MSNGATLDRAKKRKKRKKLVKIQRLDPIAFTPEALEELLNSQATGRYRYRVRSMTREEFEKAYPGVDIDMVHRER